MWVGAECWIIGGGPSMPAQFGVPSNIMQDVMEGKLPLSAYSPYFSQLHGKHVIGTNIAFMLGPWLSMMYFGDKSFFKRYKAQLAEWRNIKITHTHLTPPDLPYHKNIRKIRAVTNKQGLSSDPTEVRWNLNSGAAAINIAVHTGAKRIYLLGFDMCADLGKNTHWHAQYKQLFNFKTSNSVFKRHLIGFPEIAKDAKRMGVEILNINKRSAIQAFPKVHLKEVL